MIPLIIQPPTTILHKQNTRPGAIDYAVARAINMAQTVTSAPPNTLALVCRHNRSCPRARSPGWNPLWKVFPPRWHPRPYLSNQKDPDDHQHNCQVTARRPRKRMHSRARGGACQHLGLASSKSPKPYNIDSVQNKIKMCPENETVAQHTCEKAVLKLLHLSLNPVTRVKTNLKKQRSADSSAVDRVWQELLHLLLCMPWRLFNFPSYLSPFCCVGIDDGIWRSSLEPLHTLVSDFLSRGPI